MTPVGFDTNVFVNCPFDTEYLPLLRPLLFTIIDLGFTPRISLERLDSGAPRIERIIELIQESKYGIHDLSRLEAKSAGEVFRLNMPFELGVDAACRLFKGPPWSTKKCLILETEKYRYQAALSDMSNSDIGVHWDHPVQIVKVARDWLSNEAKLHASGPAKIWNRFNEFMAQNYIDLNARGFSDDNIKNLPIAELIDCMQRWTTGR